LAIYFGMFTRVAKVRGELRQLIAQRPQPKIELMVDEMSPMELGNVSTQLKDRLSILRTFIKKRVYWTTKLNGLAKVLPDGTWLTHISLEERVEKRAKKIARKLVLEGGAFSVDKTEEMELVNRLVTNLREDESFFEGFQELELSSIKKGTMGEFEVTIFSLTCSGRR